MIWIEINNTDERQTRDRAVDAAQATDASLWLAVRARFVSPTTNLSCPHFGSPTAHRRYAVRRERGLARREWRGEIGGFLGRTLRLLSLVRLVASAGTYRCVV